MFDDAYQAGTDAALTDLARRPQPQPKPQQRFSTWRTITAAPRGIVAAAAEALGSTADVLQAFGAASAITLEGDPAAKAAVGKKAVEEGAKRGRELIASGQAMTSDEGLSLRAAADAYRPDPTTAHAAEQVVFDFARVGGKLVAGGVVAGPFGLAGASLEEGISEAERLRRQGVDLPARTGVGVVTAVATGVGAALPLAGKTVAGTLGLVAAGGPGTFAAQQAATREILQRAGYASVAATYDPFDPVGLTVSTLLPAAFGAYGMRAARRARTAETPPRAGETEASPPDTAPVNPETVDAARVSLAVEARRAGSLADDTDIRGSARDDMALRTAEEQQARGERIDVSDLAPAETARAAQMAADVRAAGQRVVGAVDTVAARLDAAEPVRAAEQPPAAPLARAAELDDEISPELLTAVRSALRGDIDSAIQALGSMPDRPPAPRADAAPDRPQTPHAARLADLEASNPQALGAEIPVAWDAKGVATERMTARDFLAEVERRAADETRDAGLVRVAALCALRA